MTDRIEELLSSHSSVIINSAIFSGSSQLPRAILQARVCVSSPKRFGILCIFPNSDKELGDQETIPRRDTFVRYVTTKITIKIEYCDFFLKSARTTSKN